MNGLVTFWQQPLTKNNGGYFHPNDADVLQSQIIGGGAHSTHTFDSYIRSNDFGSAEDRKLHLCHRPLPYIGRLKDAKVVLLQLNPGLGLQDYLAESENHPSFSEQFLAAWSANIKQKFADHDFPMFFLDPKFCWHSGHLYWFRRLKPLVQSLKETDRFGGKSFFERLRTVSETVAVIELLPYRSQSFDHDDLIDGPWRLPSVACAQAELKKLLQGPAAARPLVVMMRSSKKWGACHLSDGYLEVKNRSAWLTNEGILTAMREAICS